MARMFPQQLSDVDGASRPEWKVFKHLEQKLDDSWNAYYSLGLVFPDDDKGKKLAEIDFVLTHPQYGIVTVEVKGKLRCKDGRWQVPDGSGWKDCGDPGHQARDHEMNVRRFLKQQLGLHQAKQRVTPVLILTGSRVNEMPLAADLPRAMIIDSAQVLDDLGGWLIAAVEAELGARDKTEPLGAEGVEQLHKLLAPTHDLTPTLADEIPNNDVAMIRLTADQKKILRGLPMTPRATVTGCAGSGKTMIARDIANEMANDGLDVLFICFNYPLALYLEGHGMNEKVVVRNFHRLCRDLAKEAGLEVPSAPSSKPDGSALEAYHGVTMPDLLYTALEKLDRSYDILIVDEAQDLKPYWYEVLESAVKDDGKIWLFMDDNQRVYEDRLEVPDGFLAFLLTDNCRNTQTIHALVRELYEGSLETVSPGPPGRPVEFLPDVPDQAAAVVEVIEDLIDNQGLAAQDITVLSQHTIYPDGGSKSRVANNPGKYGYSRIPTTEASKVHFSSIKSFKGLESPVVIVCELDRITHEHASQEIYVAYSRAKHHLVVVGPVGNDAAEGK